MPNTGWGFATLLLPIAIAYVLIADTHGIRTSLEEALGWVGAGPSEGTTTLLCHGGDGAACCHNIKHDYTPGMAITIDHRGKKVYVFNENRSAEGNIIEDKEGHLIFGKNPDDCKVTTKDATKDTTKDATKDATKDTAKDTTKDATKDTAKDTTKDATKDTANDTTKDATKDTANDTTKDATKDTANDTTKDATKDTASERCRIADGEINRLTGRANVQVIDQANNARVVWHNIECRRSWRQF
jgi:hypothetical protein